MIYFSSLLANGGQNKKQKKNNNNGQAFGQRHKIDSSRRSHKFLQMSKYIHIYICVRFPYRRSYIFKQIKNFADTN